MQHQVAADVLVAKLPEETVLLDMKSKNYFRLNATASRIWESLAEGRAVDQIVGELCAEFRVEPSVAVTEVERLIGALRTRGLLEPARA